MYEFLGNSRLENLDINALVLISANVRALTEEFALNNLPVPEELVEKNREVVRWISERRRDYLRAELKRAQARRQGLLTVDEKRLAADAEIAALTAALSPTS